MPLIFRSLLAYIGLPPCINYSGNSKIAICYNYNKMKTTTIKLLIVLQNHGHIGLRVQCM